MSGLVKWIWISEWPEYKEQGWKLCKIKLTGNRVAALIAYDF
jgi:hypothetical protein